MEIHLSQLAYPRGSKLKALSGDSGDDLVTLGSLSPADTWPSQRLLLEYYCKPLWVKDLWEWKSWGVCKNHVYFVRGA